MRRYLKLILLGLVLLAASLTLAQEPVYDLTVVAIGTHSVNGVTTPLYAISVGDPGPSQAFTEAYFSQFGVFAIDGTLLVRYPDDKSLWFGYDYRFPQTIEEYLQLAVELSTKTYLEVSFTRLIEAGEPGEVLPQPFDQLSNSDLEAVSSFTLYRDGSMRIYLNSEVTVPEIETLLATIAGDYELNVEWELDE